MKKKVSFINFIRIWGIVFLLGLGVCFIFIDIISAYHDFKIQSARIRSDYVKQQKQIIRQEVMRTVDIIRQHHSRNETATDKQIRAELLTDISHIRFGKEGYIFINRFNGDALVSNGKLFSGTKKLWEEFNRTPEKMKRIFEQEYQAALKPDGDYIRYSHIKLTQPAHESPKISFIFGLPEFQWLVGAGVYIDDVENGIARRQHELDHQIKTKIAWFALISVLVIALFFFFFSRLNHRLKSDASVFVSFLKQAAHSNETIDREQVKFIEFDQIAKYANMMTRERNRAEETLRENREWLKRILQTNPDPVVVYDNQGVPQFINPSFTTVFGWTFDEIRGQKIPFVPESEEEHTIAKIREIYQSGKPLQFLTQRLTKGGKLLSVNISAALHRDVKGGKSGLVVNLTDITEQLRLEEELGQAKKMEAIGRLAGGVAHDFNNMLSVILGNAEIILEDLEPSSRIVSGLNEIQKAAQRSTNLTRQLLAFARKQTISPKVLQLNRTIEGMLKMLGRLIGEDIELSWHPREALWPVNIDPSQIDQILANLCVNARDAIKDVGCVTIETDNVRFNETDCIKHPEFKPGEYVMIGVSDTGCGMDKATLANLFEPFFTTKSSGEGTGLGLATIYGIIKQNNGFINVYSEPDQGTTFKLYIPRYSESSGMEEPKTIAEKTYRGTETILLVEDEAAILKMTAMMLQRLGYHVLQAGTPGEAIRITHSSREKIHLLMTDVVMPSMNGRDLSEKIIGAFPDIKCLFMSGYTANVIAHRGILDQGLNFISKPFTKQNLSEKLREIFDGDAP